MQGDLSVSSAIYLCCFCFLLGRDLANCLRIAHRLPGYLHRRGQWVSFLYHERLDALLDHYLMCLSHQDHAFSPLGPTDDLFHAVVALRVPAIPSFVSLAPPVSSPYLDVNEEIDLLATGSLGC